MSDLCLTELEVGTWINTDCRNFSAEKILCGIKI